MEQPNWFSRTFREMTCSFPTKLALRQFPGSYKVCLAAYPITWKRFAAKLPLAASHNLCHWNGFTRNAGEPETLREDRGQTHTGSAPQALAALRNGIISRLRYCGWNNIAEALRHYGASVQQALRFIGWPAT